MVLLPTMSSPKEIQSTMIMRSGRQVNYDPRKKAPKNHQDDLDEEYLEFLDVDEIGSRTGSKASSRAGNRPRGTSIRSSTTTKSRVSLRVQLEAEAEQEAERELLSMQEKEIEMEVESRNKRLEMETEMRKKQFEIETDMKKKKHELEKKKIEMRLRHTKRRQQYGGSDYHQALCNEESDAYSECSDVQKLVDADVELEYKRSSSRNVDAIEKQKSSCSDVDGIGRQKSSCSDVDDIVIRKSSRSLNDYDYNEK